MPAWRALTAGVAAVVNWRFFKPAVFVACAVPMLRLAYQFWQVVNGSNPEALGADPSKKLLEELGQDAFTILLLTLSVTPVRRIFHVNRVQAVRRMLGVWSFAYLTVHLSTYLIFDQLCYSAATCDVHAIWLDIQKRPYIFMGTLGYLVLLALAITSTNGWMRRLRKNWARLHKLVYVAAIAGVVHFIWIQKSGVERPLPWIVWLTILLGVRLYWVAVKAGARRQSPVIS